MKLVSKVEDYRQHINLWLLLFQSGANITDREVSILSEVLIKREELSKDGIKEPFLTKLLFDTDARKEYCNILEISEFSLNNSLKRLKDKGVLDESYSIQKKLIPNSKLEIEFRYE